MGSRSSTTRFLPNVEFAATWWCQGSTDWLWRNGWRLAPQCMPRQLWSRLSPQAQHRCRQGFSWLGRGPSHCQDGGHRPRPGLWPAAGLPGLSTRPRTLWSAIRGCAPSCTAGVAGKSGRNSSTPRRFEGIRWPRGREAALGRAQGARDADAQQAAHGLSELPTDQAGTASLALSGEDPHEGASHTAAGGPPRVGMLCRNGLQPLESRQQAA